MKFEVIQTRRNCFPSPFGLVMGDIMSNKCENILLNNYGKAFAVYNKGLVKWYIDLNRVENVNKIISQHVIDKPEHGFKVFRKFIENSDEILSFAKELHKLEFDEKSNEFVLEKFNELIEKYYDLYPYGEVLAYAIKDHLFEYLRRLVDNKVKSKENADKCFNFLITPLKRSFLKKHYIELLNIALKHKNIEKLLDIHTERFKWIEYDYGIKILEKDDFRERLDGIGDAEKELNEIYEKERELKFEQEKYTKIVGNSELFELARLSSEIMNYKKEIFTQVHYYSRGLIEEIAKRLNLDFKTVQFLMPNEIEDALLGKIKIDVKEVRERYNFSIVIWDENGFKQLKDGDAKGFFDKNIYEDDNKGIGEEVISGVDEVKGTVVNSGNIKGKVRVITNPKDIDKLKDGEVLVTVMTTIDYVTAMKKASAIITDEGGLTCHAAIIARELGVPCIVGTKNATKVFNDGDLVEVIDGNVKRSNGCDVK